MCCICQKVKKGMPQASPTLNFFNSIKCYESVDKPNVKLTFETSSIKKWVSWLVNISHDDRLFSKVAELSLSQENCCKTCCEIAQKFKPLKTFKTRAEKTYFVRWTKGSFRNICTGLIWISDRFWQLQTPQRNHWWSMTEKKYWHWIYL